MSTQQTWELLYADDSKLDTAVLYIPICKLGNYLTEGRSSLLRLVITNSDTWNNIWDELYLLHNKPITFDSVYILNMNENEYIMDTSVWPKLLIMLTEFFINLDRKK